MLLEDQFWFSNEYAPMAFTRVTVVASNFQAQTSEIFTPQPLPRPRFLLGRLELWRLALKMFMKSPFLGVGPDNFRLLYGNVARLKVWDRRLHANNLYVEFFVSTGLVGGTLLLWLLWRVCHVLQKTWRTGDLENFPLILGISASVFAVLLHGLFDYFFPFTSIYVMTWASFGLAVACRRY